MTNRAHNDLLQMSLDRIFISESLQSFATRIFFTFFDTQSFLSVTIGKHTIFFIKHTSITKHANINHRQRYRRNNDVYYTERWYNHMYGNT